ncbi:MAG: cupin domain-containing protein [Verrucomicrobiales bacterium]
MNLNIRPEQVETVAMTVNPLAKQKPITTADGSAIRSILDSTNAPVVRQSLAEAQLPAKGETQRHYHRQSEELYFIIQGEATMEIDGELRKVLPGDGILIPAGAWHQIRASEGAPLQFLCCCAPPYSHEDTFFE